MARPIKETPVLSGKDAKRFEQEIKENEKRKVHESEYKRAIQTYDRMVLLPLAQPTDWPSPAKAVSAVTIRNLNVVPAVTTSGEKYEHQVHG